VTDARAHTQVVVVVVVMAERTMCKKIYTTNKTWTHVVYQEVRLKIGLLAKLGIYRSTVENVLVSNVTYWYAAVLNE